MKILLAILGLMFLCGAQGLGQAILPVCTPAQAAAAAAPSKDSLLAWYSLENLADSSGGGFTLTGGNSPHPVTGHVDNGYEFEADSNQYAYNHAIGARFDTSKSMTFVCWVKLARNNADMMFMALRGWDGSHMGMSLQYIGSTKNW